MEEALQILREQQKSVFSHHGISVVNVASEDVGNSLAHQILQEIINKQTVLYLSGGRTPKELYKLMAKEEMISPGAFALVDERYGEPLHENSNEKMLYDTGLLWYATALGIPFHQILSGHPEASPKDLDSSPSVQNDMNRVSAAEKYDDQVRTLLAQYQKHIAILGVGMDGHTAGLPALRSKIKDQRSPPEADQPLAEKIGTEMPDWMKDLYERAKNRMVIDYDDKGGFYKERITMTFQGLSMMDFLLVLVFGEDKKEALSKMFSDGPEPFGSRSSNSGQALQGEEEVPSRFFKRPEIARKTLLITDQQMIEI